MSELSSRPSIRTVNEAFIDPFLDQRIRDFLVSCFPKDAAAFSRSRGWHGSMPTYSILMENPREAQLIAHASIVDRTIAAGSELVHIAGVQNVCIAPSWRGQRLIDRLMHAAIDVARLRGFDLAMLFCTPALCPVYARTGWQILSGCTFIKSSDASLDEPFQLNDAAMIYPLARDAIPAGVIDLRGNDW